MSEKYIPLIRGEVYGLKIGIDTELNLWEHSKKLDYDKLDKEYLIGIGVGFTKAQQIREKLKQNNENLSFENKVRYFKYFIQKHASRYASFHKESNKFLEHIDNWDKDEIPVEVSSEVQMLLKEHKIQRAVDRIYNFNYEEYRLKSVTEFDNIKSLLPKLREQNKKGEITLERYNRGKVEIKNQLEEWIKRRKKN